MAAAATRGYRPCSTTQPNKVEEVAEDVNGWGARASVRALTASRKHCRRTASSALETESISPRHVASASTTSSSSFRDEPDLQRAARESNERQEACATNRPFYHSRRRHALHSSKQSGEERDGLVVSEVDNNNARPDADEGFKHAKGSLE